MEQREQSHARMSSAESRQKSTFGQLMSRQKSTEGQLMSRQNSTKVKSQGTFRCFGILAFAAGAMFYVVVEELIPEASSGQHSNLSTIGFAIGFVLMMVLDVVMG